MHVLRDALHYNGCSGMLLLPSSIFSPEQLNGCKNNRKTTHQNKCPYLKTHSAQNRSNISCFKVLQYNVGCNDEVDIDLLHAPTTHIHT